MFCVKTGIMTAIEFHSKTKQQLIIHRHSSNAGWQSRFVASFELGYGRAVGERAFTSGHWEPVLCRMDGSLVRMVFWGLWGQLPAEAKPIAP